MEIEIVTTKKKLTKAIVNQMLESSTTELKFGSALGYFIEIRKECYKAILIKHGDKFSIIPGNYEKRGRTVWRKRGKWRATRNFDSIEERDLWWEIYRKRFAEASQQIYV